MQDKTIGGHESGAKSVTMLTPIAPTPPKPKRVAAYARVSSGKDAMLHSLSAQVSYFSAMIQAHPGWVYAGTYADEAFTGTKGDRPAFAKLLNDCRAGLIDRIVTKSISRFARNTVTLLETVRELKALGIGVTFEEQHIDTLGGDGELLLTILASYAQAESLSASENCKWRIRKDFSEGKPVNLTFIYGYRVHKGKIEINPEQAEVVRRIFSEYVGGSGSVVIAERLREERIPRMRGGEWRSSYIIEILRNEKYMGDALLQKTYSESHLTKKKRVNRGKFPQYYAQGTHPAIIDRDTFNKAQEIMDERRRRLDVQKPTNARYPFTAMIVCGRCGKHFKRKTTNGRISWQCQTYLQKGKRFCPAKQIPENTLIVLTNEALGIAVFNEDIFARSIERIEVPSTNCLTFIFKDGRRIDKDWQDRSRAESWNDNMRANAREYANRRWHNERGDN